MSQAEIDAALDALELDSPPKDEVIVDDDPIIEDQQQEEDPIVDEPEAKNPPGYIDNINDWIAAGKDPDLFKGKKAYEAEYERIQEIRELRNLVKTVVDTTSEWKSQQQQEMEARIEQAREDAKAELERAREENDIDAAIAAKDKLESLNRKGTPAAPPQNPIITNFIKANPILDQSSPQYDQEFHRDLQMTQHSILNQLTGGDPSLAAQLTESQIQRSLNVALAKTKELHADKFVSPRNHRKGGQPPAPSKRAPQANTSDYATRLKQLRFTSMNKNDVSAANDMYEMIKAKDPKRAEAFAKTILGE